MAEDSENIPRNFLPQLVDRIFEEFQRTTRITPATKDLRGQFFCDLSDLLGVELVDRTLQLLDEFNFTFYNVKNRPHLCVVELHKGTEYYRLLPRANFCKCEFFQGYVLLLPRGILYPHIASELSILEDWTEASRSSLTCPHVLALRLQQTLHISGSKVSQQVVTKEDYKELWRSIFED